MRNKTGLVLATVALTLLLGACTPRQMIVGGLADALASQGGGNENDLELLRDAAPFHLKLSESVLAEDPGHTRLAEAVAAGFTQYAYAFVSFQADQVEAQDAKAAEQLRRRAARLYQRAQQHALDALEVDQPGFKKQLAQPGSDGPRLTADQVGLAYWCSAAWGGWISLTQDDPDVVADLPLAVRLARLAWQTDPSWGHGSLTGLLATFEAARPGGSQAQALAWFDRAIDQSAGRSASAYLAKAEGIALPAGDRAQFESLLRQALAIHDSTNGPLLTQNRVMQRRARWLLERAEDLF